MSREGIRGRAEEILQPIITHSPIRSDTEPTDNNLYKKYTGGLTQTTLETNWNTVNPKTGKKGIMTGCNAFVGWYSSQIGTTYLGGFNMEKDLAAVDKSKAWVKSAPGLHPGYGDICLHVGVHASVSLDIKGGQWARLNAGQGGPKMWTDVLKVSEGPWSHGSLQGWVDIEAYFAFPVPNWLLGWWEVQFRGDPYYYYFDRNYQVKWSEYRPRDTMTPMLATDGGVGKFSVTNRGFVTIWWRTGTVEKYSRNMLSSDERMDGKYNNTGVDVTAVRMS